MTRGPTLELAKDVISMGTRDAIAERESEAASILKARSRAELQLLKDERNAEKRLAKSEAAQRKLEARLAQMEDRVMRGRESVASAAAELRACQERRIAGPPATDS
jgi:hypothetical protein